LNEVHALDYLYASGRVRALEGSLLNRERTVYMVDARTTEDAFQQLIDCGYAIPTTTTADDLERLLQTERKRLFDLFIGILPDPTVVDVFRVRYDTHNIKVLLKSAGRFEEVADLLSNCGMISSEKFMAMFREQDFRGLPPLLKTALEEARDLLARTGDPQVADILLDKACLMQMTAIAKTTEIPFLSGYVRLLIDATNLRIYIRSNRMGKDNAFLTRGLIAGGNIPIQRFGDTLTDLELESLFSTSLLKDAANVGVKILKHQGTMTELDLKCDNALTAYLLPARMKAYGPSVVIAYIAAKESELTALRTLLTGRLLNLAPEVIMERMRDHYV